VCYSGSHLRVVPLAWLVLVVYAVGFPAVTAFWVCRTQRKQSEGTSKSDSNSDIIAMFTSSYSRPKVFYWRHIERGCLLGLSALRNWFQPSPLSTSTGPDEMQGILRLICTLVLLATTLLLLIVLQPYKKSERWKLGVQSGVFSLSFLIAFDNFRHSDTLAIVILSGCMVLILLLIASFFYFMISDVPAEKPTIHLPKPPTTKIKASQSMHVMIRNPMALPNALGKPPESQKESFARQGIARKSVWTPKGTQLQPVAVRMNRAR
jgi:hypothetical protein